MRIGDTTDLGVAYSEVRKHPNPKHKDAHSWNVQERNEVISLLTPLYPLLLLKKKQAGLAIEFCMGALNHNITDSRINEIKAELTILNKRGKNGEKEK